jgi:chorismate mutase
MDSAIDLSDAGKALDLANIRFQLMWVPRSTRTGEQVLLTMDSRLEDTITFHLIERVQFPLNRTVYVPGAIPIPEADGQASNISLLDYFLRATEKLHSLLRRYQSPDETPFFPEALEKPILQALHYPPILHENSVDVNPQIKQSYINNILPAACATREERPEQQENYGSAATCDVLLLQALSRRIHFGKFVAESKFRTETARFVDLIKKEDRQGIDEAITNKKVEETILERLRLKAKTYGTDPDTSSQDPGKINVEAVVAMYKVSWYATIRFADILKDHIIPLTKVVEVEYLMQRLKNTEWE